MIGWDEKSGEEKIGYVVVGLALVLIGLFMYVMYYPPEHSNEPSPIMQTCHVVLDDRIRTVHIPANATCADRIIYTNEGGG